MAGRKEHMAHFSRGTLSCSKKKNTNPARMNQTFCFSFYVKVAKCQMASTVERLRILISLYEREEVQTEHVHRMIGSELPIPYKAAKKTAEPMSYCA